MGVLSRFKGRKNEPEIVTGEELPCPHVVLAPKWDDAADMGIESKASRWLCGACGQQFTPAEAQQLRETEATRLKETLGQT
ncbi:MAG: hypothetical protein HYX53_04190 [Chloroflexi bacterium]|nr:hypothetical protein [Chloroflexota bacterium]